MYLKALGDGAICINGCKHNRKDAGNMIQCGLCVHWFHIGCVDLTQDECVGVWSCHTAGLSPMT